MTLTEATEKIRDEQRAIFFLVKTWTKGDGTGLPTMLDKILSCASSTQALCGELTDEIKRLKEQTK